MIMISEVKSFTNCVIATIDEDKSSQIYPEDSRFF